MSVLLPLLIALVGLFVYFTTNNKASMAGLYTYAVGLLAFLLLVGPRLVTFMGR